MDGATGSSPSPELAAALHRLRSTLARLKAELELAKEEDSAAPVERLLGDLDDALQQLRAVEQVALGLVTVLVVGLGFDRCIPGIATGRGGRLRFRPLPGT